MRKSPDPNGTLNFLKTGRPKRDLKLCLEIVREFKACESDYEWAAIPFAAWAKLEQFEDFLSLLTGELDVEDEIAKKFYLRLKKSKKP